MELSDIFVRLLEIHEHSKDAQLAHKMEDDLYYDVLAAIAKGAPNPQELATETLKFISKDRPRWY